jgi:hypothetical protein
VRLARALDLRDVAAVELDVAVVATPRGERRLRVLSIG